MVQAHMFLTVMNWLFHRLAKSGGTGSTLDRNNFGRKAFMNGIQRACPMVFMTCAYGSFILIAITMSILYGMSALPTIPMSHLFAQRPRRPLCWEFLFRPPMPWSAA